MLRRLWLEEQGFIVSAELVLVATIVVIGMLVGLVTIRDQVLQELADVAASFAGEDQSFSFSGMTGHASSTSGTIFDDQRDFCQGVFGDDLPGQAAHCIQISGGASSEDL